MALSSPKSVIYEKSVQNKLEAISKIVAYAQGRDANRFKNGAYT